MKTGKKDHNGNEINLGDKIFVNYKCKFNNDSFFGVVCKYDDEDDFYIKDALDENRNLDLAMPSNWLFIVNCKR